MSYYTLYTDKNENFECEVSVKNASLKGSIARLVVESADGTNLIFNGQIQGEKCVIPIKRLRGLLEENSHGNVHLEVIVEDTYFKPWKSNFVVEEHTSVKVKVNEATPQISKPVINVRVLEKRVITEDMNQWLPLYEITEICKKFNITRATIRTNGQNFRQLIHEYFKANPEFGSKKSQILNNLRYFIK